MLLVAFYLEVYLCKKTWIFSVNESGFSKWILWPQLEIISSCENLHICSICRFVLTNLTSNSPTSKSKGIWFSDSLSHNDGCIPVLRLRKDLANLTGEFFNLCSSRWGKFGCDRKFANINCWYQFSKNNWKSPFSNSAASFWSFAKRSLLSVAVCKPADAYSRITL